MKWRKQQFTYVFIFNTKRGLSVFIRNPLNHGILYDLGASSGFSPLEWLSENIFPSISEFQNKYKVAQLVISHPHADHITEIEKIKDNIGEVSLVTCPHDKSENESIDWERINNPETASGLVNSYKNFIKDRSLPLQTIKYTDRSIAPNCEYGIYYVRPPQVAKDETSDQEYTNGISIVLYYRHGNKTLIIPGDITPASFNRILKGDSSTERRFTDFGSSEDSNAFNKETSNQKTLGKRLEEHGLSFYVTPHHGLESGFCSEIYNYLPGKKVGIHLISEKRHTGKNDGSTHANYSSDDYSKGMNVTVIGGSTEKFKQYSTANNKNILLMFDGSSQAAIYTHDDPNELKKIALED